ncbi:MAG: hypothetical protein ACREID_03935, partial [Planctomycetota bacterium]
ATSVGEVHPERVAIHFRDSEGESGRAAMKADLATRVYRHEFKEIAFPIVFRLEGGDEVTADYRVELMEPPEAREVEVTVSFPEYAGRAPVAVDLAAGDPEVLPGGAVAVRGRSSKPLAEAHLVLGEAEEEALPATLSGDDRFEVAFAPSKSVLAGIRLRDRDGLANPVLAPRFLVRVVPDREPKVRLQTRGVGAIVVPEASVPYVVRVRDDVKTVEGRIEAKRSAGDREAPAPTVIAFDPKTLGAPGAELEGVLELGSLRLSPGAFLTLVAFAKDNAEPEAHEGKSDPVSLKVVTIEELLSDLLRRQQEQRRDFEELIARERALRDRYRTLRDAPPAAPAEAREALESQAREQRQVARRVQSIERSMAQVLDEMLHNHVTDPSRIDDLRHKVVVGLQRLRDGPMAAQSEALDDLGRRAAEGPLAGKSGEDAARGYESVLASMDAVLANMVKVEGFTEIVESMRALLQLQADVLKTTRARFTEMMRKIFGEGFKPDDEPPPGGK